MVAKITAIILREKLGANDFSREQIDTEEGLVHG